MKRCCYDPIGNRTSASENGLTNLYAANSLNQYTALNPASPNPTPFTYDPDGNMTQYGDLAFSWDAENRLLGVASNGIALVTNRYDYMSRRIEKGSAGGTNAFLYDGWNLIRENTTSSPVAVEITNPDFADGLDSWTYSNVEASTCGPQTVAKFTTSGAWLEQDIGAIAGEEYLVTFRYHPSGCGGAPGYGSYPWNITVSIGDATASTNGSYAPWATWNSMSNFTFRLRPSTAGPLRITVGGMPNPVTTHIVVSCIAHSSVKYVGGLDLSTTLYGASGIGGVLCTSEKETTLFTANDGLGNITSWIYSGIGRKMSQSYGPFGQHLCRKDFDLSTISCFYSSKVYDFATSQSYYGYRYYVPVLGRWLTKDKIGLAGGMNPYAFLDNNSVNRVDILGLKRYEVPATPQKCKELAWIMAISSMLAGPVSYQLWMQWLDGDVDALTLEMVAFDATGLQRLDLIRRVMERKDDFIAAGMRLPCNETTLQQGAFHEGYVSPNMMIFLYDLVLSYEVEIGKSCNKHKCCKSIDADFTFAFKASDRTNFDKGKEFLSIAGSVDDELINECFNDGHNDFNISAESHSFSHYSWSCK